MAENWLAAADKPVAPAPDPAALRIHSRQCREAARGASDPTLKKELARRAFEAAQLAEQAERSAVLSTPFGLVSRATPAAFDRARFWRDAAEECRAFAERLMFRETRATYRRLAEYYDAMAERESGPAA